MLNKRVFELLILVLFFLSSNNSSLAFELQASENVYPDLSSEFCGRDKFENFNRRLLIVNLKLNKCIVKPVNILWASIMPQYGMDRLKNGYNNMNYPLRCVSCLLQKDFSASKTETARFFINTTIGFGGMFDPALTKFKIEPCQEDMAQALAHFNIKQGPYLVLPVVRGNIRDLCGKLLNCPFRPTSYIGPFGAAVNAVFAINNTTYSQPMIKKVDESFADPYEIIKQVDGMNSYIKNNNFDRNVVFLEKVAAEKLAEKKIIPANSTSEDEGEKLINSKISLRPDIDLQNFCPQCSLTDSMRTAYFDNQKIDSSIWSELSVWNRNFKKNIKSSSISLHEKRNKYTYRYALQKDKNSPLAILYPSIGDGVNSDKSTMLAKVLYEEGYSVLLQGSSFNWEFIKSMPEGFHPGIPQDDAKYLRETTAKIIDDIQLKKGYKFSDKIIVGCSFGALTGIFVTEQDEKDKTIGISKLIAICPPVEIFYALKSLDKYTQDWKKSLEDIKMRTALAGEKVVRLSYSVFDKKLEEMPTELPFTEDDSKLVIGFLMKQKLSDVLFAINHCTRCNKSNLYQNLNHTTFYDYAKEYLFTNGETDEQIGQNTSLYPISDFLKTSRKYKIYHAMDDYFVNKKQLSWLKETSGNRSIFFSNGSHLGFMYRKEFLEKFKEDIKLAKSTSDNGV